MTEFPPVVRRSAFAKMIGVSPSAVTKAVASGKLAGDALGPSGLICVLPALRQLGRSPDEIRMPAGQIDGRPATAPRLLHATVDLLRSRVKLAALELESIEARLVDTVELNAAFASRVDDLRPRLRAAIAEVVPRVATLRDANDIERELAAAIDRAMTASADATEACHV